MLRPLSLPTRAPPDADRTGQADGRCGPHPSAPASFRLGYRPALDGLRGIAVLAVMVHHSSLRSIMRGGFLGVDIFLVLSGFLITALLVQDYDRTGTIRFKHFYLRRMLRLCPALFLLLAACCLFAAVCPAEKARVVRQAVLVTFCYLANLAWCFGVRLDLLSHAWSLSVEEQFYLLWPFVLYALLWLKVRRRRIVLLLLLAIVASALLRAALWLSFWPIGPDVALISLATRADSLLAGCLVGLICCWDCLPRSWGAGIALQAGAWAAISGLMCLLMTAPERATYLYCGGLTLVAGAVALLIAALVSAPATAGTRVLSAAPLVWIGRISYGLYLWHFPMATFVPALMRRLLPVLRENVFVRDLLEFSLAFAAASFSFYGVEQPFLRLKKQLAQAPSGREEPTLERWQRRRRKCKEVRRANEKARSTCKRRSESPFA